MATITTVMSLVILENRVNTYNPNFNLKYLPTRNGGRWPRMFSDDNRIWTFKDYLNVESTDIPTYAIKHLNI